MDIKNTSYKKVLDECISKINTANADDNQANFWNSVYKLYDAVKVMEFAQKLNDNGINADKLPFGKLEAICKSYEDALVCDEVYEATSKEAIQTVCQIYNINIEK